MRRTLTFAGCVVVIAALAVAPARADVGAREIAGGLQQPVAFTFGPDRQLWYVEKDSGEIRVIDLATGDDRLFETVGGVNGEGERGMLGIALHPRYPDRPFVYVYATRSVNGSLRNQILRYQDRNGTGANLRTIFSSPASSSPYHNGGRILFGRDGMLYAIVGEGHAATNSQNLDNELGKILRMTPAGGVPRSNPFNNRIWAFGIRNSFGFAFDPETGVLWATDNGPECNDEVNVIEARRNYGWGPNATCSGGAPQNTNQDGQNPVLPVALHENAIGITGIAFCDGCGLGPQSEGTALHGAVTTGQITRLELNQSRNDVVDRQVVANAGSGTLSFEVAPGGRIFFSTFGGIFRLVQA